MARPVFTNIVSGLEAWDGDVNDNFEIFSLAPWPMYQHTGDESDLATDFPPASFDRCFVMVDHTTLGWSLYISDTTWKRLWSVGTIATVVALTDNSGGSINSTLQALTDPLDAPGTADALRDDLVAILLPELRNNYADLAAKINEVHAALTDHGLIT